jgi:purine-binding chemotaxis protein CheW
MDEKKIAADTGGQLQRRLHERQEGKVIQMIVFHLGDEEFGTNIDQVREIIRKGPITPIPDSPDFILGVTNVRGEIAVVIDLKQRFFLQGKKDVEEKHIVMTEQDKNLFGLMVDEVTEVLRIPESDIKTTPELVTKIDRLYISGVLTVEDRLIMMLDLTKVLSEEELAKLSEVRLRHQHSVERAREKEEEDREREDAAEQEKKEAKISKAPKKEDTPKTPVSGGSYLRTKSREKGSRGKKD